MTRRTPIDWAAEEPALRRARAVGDSLATIAAAYGVSKERVRQVCKYLGIPWRGRALRQKMTVYVDPDLRHEIGLASPIAKLSRSRIVEQGARREVLELRKRLNGGKKFEKGGKR